MRPTALHAPRGRLLAVDDDKGSLGDAALQLVRLGVDVLLASGRDEAELLARQEGQALRGVLLPSASVEELLDPVLAGVLPHTGLGPESLALLGPRLAEEHMRELRERGLWWRLWTPFEERDLRFIGRTLVVTGSEMDLRMDLRVPTALPGRVERRGQKADVLIGDLSRSGAYVETQGHFPTGNQLTLEISLPSEPVRVRALIRWLAAAPEGARPRGFGVEFLRPSGAVVAAICEHLAGELERFQL